LIISTLTILFNERGHYPIQRGGFAGERKGQKSAGQAFGAVFVERFQMEDQATHSGEAAVPRWMTRRISRKLAWLAVAVAFGGFWMTHLSYMPFWSAGIKSLLTLGSFGLAAALDRLLWQPRFFQRQRWMAYLLAVLAAAGLLTWLRYGLEDLGGILPPAFVLPAFPKLPFGLLLGTLYFFQLLAVHAASLLGHLFLAWMSAQKRAHRLAEEKLAAELSLLKSQVNPHFLFNALNNIYALSYTNDPQTPEAVLMLAGLMRYLLEDSQAASVPLQREIEFLESYLALQRIKSSAYERVSVAYGHLPPHSRVPPMLLLPFFENLFKHGDLETNPQGHARMSMGVSPEGWLCLELENTCREGRQDGRGGFGLRNAAARLRLLYGAGYRLSCGQEGILWTVSLQIPLSP
jgi:hypothetical protein